MVLLLADRVIVDLSGVTRVSRRYLACRASYDLDAATAALDAQPSAPGEPQGNTPNHPSPVRERRLR